MEWEEAVQEKVEKIPKIPALPRKKIINVLLKCLLALQLHFQSSTYVNEPCRCCNSSAMWFICSLFYEKYLNQYSSFCTITTYFVPYKLSCW